MRQLILPVMAGWMLLIGAADLARADGESQAIVDFNRDVRPILSKRCFACHGRDEDHREAGLRLDQRDAAIGELDSGETAIVPGDAQASELLRRIASDDDDLRMPPADHGDPLTESQIGLLRKWIEQGAPYSRHWAFVPPARADLPRLADSNRAASQIDYFVQARLERAGLTLSPAADRHTQIRRLSLDLRGLPPTRAEVEEFVTDARPDAYQRLVDRYLADPAFGERWARMWLDQARYADSAGYGSDPLRTIWRYRDWVIDAINANLPYDQFTIEQLAGDLLPDATLRQQVATAMHRNTMTNTEGGTDDEEFRVAAVRDRVDSTMQVWMGLTMGCAKCHSHKYDPISQREYYQFFAFFNQTADTDQPAETPVLKAPTKVDLARGARLDRRIAELRKKLDAATPEFNAEQAAWEKSLEIASEWTPLAPRQLDAKGGAQLQRLDDNSIRAGGENPPGATYTVIAPVPAGAGEITAFRLEALPDESLSGNGPGRADGGRFVLSRFSVAAGQRGDGPAEASGRFVRIELPGDKKMLSLAEVQVVSSGENVALTGTAKQSSTDYSGAAKRAIDGNTDGHYFNANSTTHTKVETNPWWEIDLGQIRAIEKIVVYNRTDGDLEPRLSGFRIAILDEQRETIWQAAPKNVPDPSSEFAISGEQTVLLARAVSRDSAQGLPAAGAIENSDSANLGWSGAAPGGEPRTAVFIAEKPLKSNNNTDLAFTLEHAFEQPQHTLGRFRISVTSDKRIRKRLNVPAEMLAIVDTPRGQRVESQADKLATFFRSIAPSLKSTRDQIAKLEKSRPAAPTVPVMKELPADQRRQTFVMVRGNFLSPGEEVDTGVPAAFHPLPDDAPRNRLGVARWLVHRDNPLTARVAVNRMWAQLFGAGLVVTEEDWGVQGEAPTHPQLLDWLAVEFMENGWDSKALLKTIVTSAVYRQSSRVTPELLDKDANNRLLSRGPRHRLEAEMVRDQALALAGLLSRKMRGPSVYPPQPPGLWRAAFNGRDRKWDTDTGEDRYRRGLYTFWRRTIPYPSMAVFDAPSREICNIRRIRTNTPLQALVTLNDPVYVEAAQGLARRIVSEGGETTEQRAAYALQLCLVRAPRPQQIEQLTALFESELAHYRGHLDDARQIAADPLGPLPPDADAAELAAWTIVGNVLLNLDGVLSKN